MSARVVLRTDVGRSHGLGHLQRTVALAEALELKNSAPTLALVGDEPGEDVFGYRRFPLRLYHDTPASSDELAWALAVVDEQHANVLVVDSYLVDEQYLRGSMEPGVPVAMIDDLASMEFPCDLVVGPNAHSETLPYRGSPTTRFLLGPRFALLRSDFWNPSRRLSPGGEHPVVLVTVGGADPHGLMPTLTKVAASCDPHAVVIGVVGPFFQPWELSHPRIELKTAPASLHPLMQRCDLAVSSGGQTLYELAAMGVPTVAVEVADNQRKSLLALATAGVVIPAGRAGDPALEGIVAEVLGGLARDGAARAKMSAIGGDLIDGRGALRVADAVLALAAGT